jgi:hypothetical protein
VTPLRVIADFPEITVFPSEGLSSPRIHSGLVGVQHALSTSIVLEANVMFSRGGRLLTTDRWNRQASIPGPEPTARRRFNNALPDLLYRANQGRSSYRAFSLTARGRSRRVVWQASYTLGHAKDNQSDPVLGDFSDLGFSGNAVTGRASFARQFDPDTDWGNADFDQRHNFVFYGVAEWRGWELAGVGAIRSGFPFTVESPGMPPLNHNPADLVNPDAVWLMDNGERRLNAAAFAPAVGRVGNSGRNSFYGPGLYNFDLSLGRRFRIAESISIGARLDAFNVLNHENIGNPVSRLGDPKFGTAPRGNTERPNAFRVLSPFADTGRRLQGSVRFEF